MGLAYLPVPEGVWLDRQSGSPRQVMSGSTPLRSPLAPTVSQVDPLNGWTCFRVCLNRKKNPVRNHPKWPIRPASDSHQRSAKCCFRRPIDLLPLHGIDPHPATRGTLFARGEMPRDSRVWDSRGELPKHEKAGKVSSRSYLDTPWDCHICGSVGVVPGGSIDRHIYCIDGVAGIYFVRKPWEPNAPKIYGRRMLHQMGAQSRCIFGGVRRSPQNGRSAILQPRRD